MSYNRTGNPHAMTFVIHSMFFPPFRTRKFRLKRYRRDFRRGGICMSKQKFLGLAAGALLLFGVQQVAGAASAAAQDDPAETSAATGAVGEQGGLSRQRLWKPRCYRPDGIRSHGSSTARVLRRVTPSSSLFRACYYRPRYWIVPAPPGYYPGNYAHRYYPGGLQ